MIGNGWTFLAEENAHIKREVAANEKAYSLLQGQHAAALCENEELRGENTALKLKIAMLTGGKSE